MLFHMYLTPVILIPVTKQQNKNTNKQTLHINQRTKQRTLKPLAYTATHSHKHVQYTQQQKISTTKQIGNTHTTTYIHAYIHKIQK